MHDSHPRAPRVPALPRCIAREPNLAQRPAHRIDGHRLLGRDQHPVVRLAIAAHRADRLGDVDARVVLGRRLLALGLGGDAKLGG